jgi:hypothetical protein
MIITHKLSRILLLLSAATGIIALSSCADTPTKKPVGPVSQNSSISWNQQVPGQGLGQFGMLPQNQNRR